MPQPNAVLPKWNVALIAVALAALTAFAFWPVTGCDFIHYDDPDYVTANPQVQQGLTLDSAAWAFTTGEAGNWHPLTWLSLMLDYDFYRLQPAGYHLTNLLLHAANVALLFLLLNAMTDAPARSALVAALFAVHPLRVESVAWVSERKDVLCAFFGILALWAYVGYVRRASLPRYALVLVFFALSLMAKPMLVTLPFLLLLLDFWPLGRLQAAAGAPDGLARHSPLIAREKLVPLILEKLPLLAVAVASSVVTFLVQYNRAVKTLDAFPWSARLANVPISYFRYVEKMFRFDQLAPFYPFPAAWPLWQALACSLFVIVVGLFVLWRLRPNPWLAVGWFWYLGLLVPVIGLVQVGDQSLADRYSYLPTIGLLIMFAWSLPEWLFQTSAGRVVLGVAAAGCLGLLTFCARAQIGYWRDTPTLFEHALAVTENNHVAHDCLGVVLLTHNRPAEAVAHFQQAVAVHPSEELYCNLGGAQRAARNPRAAVIAYTHAAKLQPRLADAYRGRAGAYEDQRNWQKSLADYDKAIELDSQSADAFQGRANVLLRLGQPEAALRDLQDALRLKPGSAEIYNNLGVVLGRLGNLREALASLAKSVELNPRFPDAYFNRARTYARLAETDTSFARLAVKDMSTGSRLAAYHETAAKLRADTAKSFFVQATTLIRARDYRHARVLLDCAIELEPGAAMALNARAWLLATCPDEGVRDGRQAVADATKACELTSWKAPEFMDTLAAAYAESGDFQEAVRRCTEALKLADGKKELTGELQTHVELYRAAKPLRDEPPAEPPAAIPEKGKI